MAPSRVLKDIETDEIRRLIVDHGGNLTDAARELDVKPRTFRDEVQHRGLQELANTERGKATLQLEAALDAVRQTGSIRQAAAWLGVPFATLYEFLSREGKTDEVKRLSSEAVKERKAKQQQKSQAEPVGITKHADGSVTMVQPTQQAPQLGDISVLIRERGLDPDEWVVVSTTLNEWDGMTSAQTTGRNEKMRLRQWKVTLQRAPHLVLAMPATYFPPAKRTPGPPKSEKPDVILIQGDHQIPFMHQGLFESSLDLTHHLRRKHRLTDIVFLGDTSDFPTISRHADHPATALAEVNPCIQSTVEALQATREAAPGARIRKLKGNHDWRVESELLLRAERMYGIRPGKLRGEEEQLPALSLINLLRLQPLDIELVEDPRGWEHGEVVLVEGQAGLVVRHGWLTSANSALKSMKKRGRSLIVGHTHRREHHYEYEASAGIERQAVTLGAMCLVRDERFPHYVVCDNWLQGLGLVTRWPDGRFLIEHGIWDGSSLTWRDRVFGSSPALSLAA